jgi:8-oxo-dGTP pyrophosphatase MutT (NUDIX family)
MAAPRGDNGGFILAEMGAHTSNAGQIYFPAGTPDPHDIVGDRVDLDGSARRELGEETGLRPDETAFASDWLVVDAGPRLACMKLVEIGAPADEVAREINRRIAAQANPELAGVRVVRDAHDIDRERMPAFVVAYLLHMLAARGA